MKLFDANELLNFVKIENMSLLEKVKSLELELSVAREQLDRSSTSKLDDMLNVQKFVSDKTGLGFVESGSSFVVHPPKFVPTTCTSVVHPSLSQNLRIPINLEARNNTNLNGFVISMVELGILGQIALNCMHHIKASIQTKSACAKSTRSYGTYP